MRIYVNLRQEATINPIDVIDKLIEETIGDSRNWVHQKNGICYRVFKSGGGTHSWAEEEEISMEKYVYVKSLMRVKDYLEEKSKKA